MDFRPGTRWNRYEIVSRIAVGGMAEVYRARRWGPAGFCKEVALKRMRPEFVGDPGFRRMFEREATISARLNHPNLVQAFEIVEQGGELALSMEFVPGISLRKLLAEERGWGRGSLDGARSVWLAAYIAWGVARALGHAWNARDESGAPMRLIHRDVSPHNLLLSREGSVKLIDFGIARPLGEESDAGVVKGKLLYMSPEQLVGGALDARTDLYSLGIVLYESALGLKRPLFDAETEALVRAALLKRQVVPPARLDPDFPEDLSALIMKALDRDPDRRFASASAMARALEALIARHWRGGSLAGELARVVQRRQRVCRVLRRPRSTPLIVPGSSERPDVPGAGLGKALRLSPLTRAARHRHLLERASGRTRVAARAGGTLHARSIDLDAVPVLDSVSRAEGPDAGACLVSQGEGPSPAASGSCGARSREGSARSARLPPEGPAPPRAQGRGDACAADGRLPSSKPALPAIEWDARHVRRVRQPRSRASIRQGRRQARQPRARLSRAGLQLPRATRAGQRPWDRGQSLLSGSCLRNAPYALALIALFATFWSLSKELVDGRLAMAPSRSIGPDDRAASRPIVLNQRLVAGHQRLGAGEQRWSPGEPDPAAPWHLADPREESPPKAAPPSWGDGPTSLIEGARVEDVAPIGASNGGEIPWCEAWPRQARGDEKSPGGKAPGLGR